MQGNKNKFKEIAGKTLREFEVKPPDNLWSKIEKATYNRKRRIFILRVTSIAASIILLASFGIFFLNSNYSSPKILADKVTSKEENNKKPSVDSSINDTVNLNNSKKVKAKAIEIKGPETESGTSSPKSKNTKTIQRTIPPAKKIMPVNRNASSIAGTHNYIAETKLPKSVYNITNPEPQEIVEYVLTINEIPIDTLHIRQIQQIKNIEDLLPDDNLTYEDSRLNKSDPWSLALGYNITSGEEFNNNGDQLSSSRSSYTHDQFSAYLANETSYFEEIENTEHDAPVSVGLTIDIPANRRLSFETGIMYTKLGFRIKTDEFGSYYSEYRNQIHYLGIPAGIRFSFIEKKHFDLYALQWIVLEKGIAGRWYINEYGNNTLLTSEANHHKINGVQVSSISGLGVQYRLTKHLHLFGQGGVQLFFLNQTQPYNIRSSRVAWPSFQTGLRLGF